MDSHLKIWPGLFRKSSRARVSERCWLMCIHLHWILANKLSICQTFWKDNLLALIRNENHKNYFFKFKLVGLSQVANLIAISYSCLLFQQYFETIQEDIVSGYCLHAVLFYSDNISRDDFKNAFGWLLYMYLFWVFIKSSVRRHSQVRLPRLSITRHFVDNHKFKLYNKLAQNSKY